MPLAIICLQIYYLAKYYDYHDVWHCVNHNCDDNCNYFGDDGTDDDEDDDDDDDDDGTAADDDDDDDPNDDVEIGWRM